MMSTKILITIDQKIRGYYANNLWPKMEYVSCKNGIYLLQKWNMLLAKMEYISRKNGICTL